MFNQQKCTFNYLHILTALLYSSFSPRTSPPEESVAISSIRFGIDSDLHCTSVIQSNPTEGSGATLDSHWSNLDQHHVLCLYSVNCRHPISKILRN